jgi:hypothetical protein
MTRAGIVCMHHILQVTEGMECGIEQELSQFTTHVCHIKRLGATFNAKVGIDDIL